MRNTLREHKNYVGNCTEIGNTNKDYLNKIFSDATEFAQDLGYYATFDDFEDPEDSNYIEITMEEFADEVADPVVGLDHEHIFLKRYDDSIYIDYVVDSDVHYIFA